MFLRILLLVLFLYPLRIQQSNVIMSVARTFSEGIFYILFISSDYI